MQAERLWKNALPRVSLTVTGFNLVGQTFACKEQRSKEKFPFALEA